jgi:hypothetical protein
MADEQRLITIVHISDLHFSDRQPGAGTDPGLPPLLARLPFLDGVLGHHRSALNQLDRLYNALGEGQYLVVTGDLTANGATGQRTLVDNFISRPSQTADPGLNVPQWKNLGIYGNHDHWGGVNAPIGGPTAGFGTFFGQFPLVPGPIMLDDDILLRFLLIDTDAEVGSMSSDRVLARGKFVHQLTQIQALLPAQLDDNEIRVLLMHHSCMPGDPTAAPSSPSRLAPLEIVRGTRQVLDRFLVDYGIRVILCGHRHTPRLSRIFPSNGFETSLVFEVRCGTTTQLDRYPNDILSKINVQNRTLPPNSLVLHRVFKRPDGVYWRSEAFFRSVRHGGFIHHTRFSNDPRLGALTDEIRVL